MPGEFGIKGNFLNHVFCYLILFEQWELWECESDLASHGFATADRFLFRVKLIELVDGGEASA